MKREALPPKRPEVRELDFESRRLPDPEPDPDELIGFDETPEPPRKSKRRPE